MQLTLDIILEILSHVNNVRPDLIKNSLLNRAKQGYSVTRPPLGYVPSSTPGLFKMNKLGQKMKALFETIVNDELTIEEGLEALSALIESHRHLKVSKSKLEAIITNPFYSGHVTLNGKSYPGLHKALISPEDQNYLARLYKDSVKQG